MSSLREIQARLEEAVALEKLFGQQRGYSPLLERKLGPVGDIVRQLHGQMKTLAPVGNRHLTSSFKTKNTP